MITLHVIGTNDYEGEGGGLKLVRNWLRNMWTVPKSNIFQFCLYCNSLFEQAHNLNKNQAQEI